MNTTSNRRQLTSGISIIAIAAAMGFATPASAQEQTASLQGHVEGAAAGAQVVATDQLTGQKGVGTVDAQGNYTILGLRPSTYSVAVAGKDAQSTTLLVGQTVTLDFGTPAAAAAATAGGRIVVTGRRTAQPTQAQTVATNITTAQIENLPQNQRNFLSFADLAPGVAVTRGGNAQLQAGALSSSNTNVLLDGMSFKNPINHGGVFGQNFGLGNPFPQVAIQEYQIQTQNFGAETGQAGSAVISAITKTGGNKIHGSAFIQWQPKSFIEQPYFDKKAGLKKPPYDRKQFGGEIGGPIIPGKLHFYLAAEGLSQKLPSSTGNVLPIFPSALVSQVNVSHNGDFHQGLYFGKLTYYMSPSDTFNLIGYVRRESNLTDIAGNATESHGRHILTRQTRGQFQWTHTQGNFYNQFNAAWDKGEQSTPRVTTGPEFVLSNGTGTDFSEGILTGAHFFEQGDKQRYITLKNDSTLRLGTNTVKFGGLLNFMSLSRTVANAFDGRYYYPNPGPSGTFDPATNQPYGARINVQPSPTLNAKNTQMGLYVQDEWKPDDRWTVNAGIRWDYETNDHNNKYVTPTAIATALRNYQGWQARGIDPNDYISTGNNRKADWKRFQPRLGVSYDVHGDRDLILFGGAGRYYDRPLFIEGVIETLTNSNNIRTVFFCPNGGASQGTGTGVDAANCARFTSALRDPAALRTLAASQNGSGGDVFVLPNKLRSPYSDQFDIGVRKRFGDITAELTYSHIESHHIFMFERANFYSNGWYSRRLTTNSTGAVIGCTDGGIQWIQDFTPGTNYAACPAQNGQLAGFSGKLNRGADNGRARYDAIYVKIEKPFTDRATWGFTQALTVSNGRSNVAQELNSDEFYNGPFLDSYGWNRVNGTEKWRSVTSATFRAPYGFTLSGLLTLTSGPSFGKLLAPWNSSIQPPDGACCYANFGGVYFPKKDIGYKRLDLRVAKTFKMPWGHEATIDFAAFNVFNWLNRNYSAWGAGAGDNPPLKENSQVGNDQREFQVGLKYKF
ncbi:TonB-dependent receptor [Sphingomonas flavescens]|uniref:TonB-dependent receptor n=1 Tax=Sphingomonas flavescens TaxID=3132797 RepID=UPI002806319E|nr:TonB-dependent receptor [Sphingomonas limnosediminicola]